MDIGKRAEIEGNLSRFLELLPDLMKDHADQHVLMRHGAVVGYFETALDAQIAGNQQFQDRLFSIQHVQEVAEELGHFAHAVHSG
jgi:hypothetical protein